MDIPIAHQAFQGRGLMVRPAGLLKGPRVVIDGSEVKGRRLRFPVRDNSGNELVIRLRSNGIDPIPKVEMLGQVLELARPLKWNEYLWIGLPILLALQGGFLGALIGFSATYSSARIFRSDRTAAAKYGLTALISLAAVGVFFVLVILLQILIGSTQAK